MSCERYQQLLHLNRPGELSPTDADDLHQHLARCEGCSLEWRRIQRATELLNPLTSYSPAPPSQEKLTSDIMRRVREAEASGPSQSMVDRILDFFLIPAVRYSTVATILAVVMTLTIQSLTLLSQISDLERRIGSTARRDAGATYTMHSETLRGVVKSEKIQSPTGGGPFAVTNGQVEISAKAVDSFLSAAHLRNLPAIIGSSALQVDQETLQKIVNEIKATAKLTFRVG